MSQSQDISESGRSFYGNKTLQYLKKKSREAVEQYTNTTVLYYELDIPNSRKNFYGEIMVKKFVNPVGIHINGVIEILEGSEIVVGEVPNKLVIMNFNCYLQHLEELNIQPKLGDFFATKNRIYSIYDKTVLDANVVAVGTDRESLSIRYKCVAIEDEQLYPGIRLSHDGQSKNSITGESQY